jgi:hypothetical protein
MERNSIDVNRFLRSISCSPLPICLCNFSLNESSFFQGQKKYPEVFSPVINFEPTHPAGESHEQTHPEGS